MSEQLSEQLDFAKNFALEAGSLMKKNFTLGMQKVWKDDKTPVTVTDETINSNLIAQVKTSFPTYAVKGEEENLQIANAEMTWVCDPVDGTYPFSHGIPIATFSLALVDKSGKPQLGVVYDPFTERLAYAVVGGGAFLNDNPIQVSDRKTLEGAVVDVDVWADRIDLPNDRLREALLDEDVRPLSLCSVIFGSYLVGAGELDGVIFNVPKPEDIAAVKVIVEEAGGKVTDLQGNEQSYLKQTNGAILSNGLIHQQLIDVVNRKRV